MTRGHALTKACGLFVGANAFPGMMDVTARSGERAPSAPRPTEIVEAADAHGRRPPCVKSEDDYGFGAGTVDALNGGGAFLSLASGPRRYRKGASST